MVFDKRPKLSFLDEKEKQCETTHFQSCIEICVNFTSMFIALICKNGKVGDEFRRKLIGL